MNDAALVGGGFCSAAPVFDGLGIDNGGIGLWSTGGTARLTQMTATDVRSLNPDTMASGLSLDALGTASITLGNGVIWGNDDAVPDIYMFGAVNFRRVHYETSNREPTANDFRSSGDPHFVSMGDSRLRPDSSLIDTRVGSLGAAGPYDIDDLARVQGVAVDVGAFGSVPDRIHAYGFE